MKIFKAHSLGNDFILIQSSNSLDSFTKDFILKINNRFTGIGADQVLIIDKNKNVRIWTEDGTVLMLCGNGLRCLGKLLNMPSVTLNTDSGPVELKLLQDSLVSLKVQKKTSIRKEKNHYVVDVGNLHKIYFTENIDDINIVSYVNDDYIVSFLSKQQDKWLIRTMETHTTKETLACGSASLAAANTLHHLGYEDLTVHFKYGAICHQVQGEEIIQIGPTQIVAEIKFVDGFLQD